MQLSDINRQTVEWMCKQCFPFMMEVNESRSALYNNTDAEYWNSKIVGYVLAQVEKKFAKKLNTKSFFYKINLEPAEVVTLYRFFFNYPVNASFRWGVIQRQFIIDQLHAQMSEPPMEKNNFEYATQSEL
jgi:hypothetical protein